MCSWGIGLHFHASDNRGNADILVLLVDQAHIWWQRSQVLGAHYHTISGQGIVPPRFRHYLENGASERNSETGLGHRRGTYFEILHPMPCPGHDVKLHPHRVMSRV